MGILDQLTSSGLGKRLFRQEALILEVTEAIHLVLEKKNITQKALARMLGVNPPRVSKMLSGSSNITLRTLADIGNALDVKIRIYIDEDVANTVDTAHTAITQIKLKVDSLERYVAHLHGGTNLDDFYNAKTSTLAKIHEIGRQHPGSASGMVKTFRTAQA